MWGTKPPFLLYMQATVTKWMLRGFNSKRWLSWQLPCNELIFKEGEKPPSGAGSGIASLCNFTGETETTTSGKSDPQLNNCISIPGLDVFQRPLSESHTTPEHWSSRAVTPPGSLSGTSTGGVAASWGPSSRGRTTNPAVIPGSTQGANHSSCSQKSEDFPRKD